LERSQLIDTRVAKLTGGFAHYVQTYDQRVSFTSRQLAAHKACLALRREAGSVRAAVNDERFVESLIRTLRAWRLGNRASRLAAPAVFAAALRSSLPALEALEGLAIDAEDLPDDIGEQLWTLIESLGIVENKAKIVAGTKALHHLLPDLVVPMDHVWTGKFFQFHPPEWQGAASQRRIFRLAYRCFADVARQVQVQRYVSGQGWRTCRTKVIDNALIGFCMDELGTPLPPEASGNQISFHVRGDPPIKDGSTSVFAAKHPHAPRVRALLEAADRALSEADFVPVKKGNVALEVVLYAPPVSVVCDATNYLGGIADVLEEKASHRLAIDHLGALTTVWLYWRDSQIKQVNYREVPSDRLAYWVTVRSL
jgi:hypothetical protein